MFSPLILIVFFYIVAPYVLNEYAPLNPSNTLLIKLSLISIISIGLGFLFSNYLKVKIQPVFKLKVNPVIFYFAIGYFFLVFVICLTSTKIPLFSALYSVSKKDLMLIRGDFLKNRTGLYSILSYLFSMVSHSLLPYFLLVSFAKDSKFKWLLMLIGYFALLLTMVKASLFIAILPLLFFALHKKKIAYFFLLMALFIMTLYLNMYLTKFAGSSNQDYSVPINENENEIWDISKIYSPSYARIASNMSRTRYILWRTFVVPTFTATDTLHFHRAIYHSNLLYGGTSRAVSYLFRQPYINLENKVYRYQYTGGHVGGSRSGSANSVYFVYQYANFGIIGVILSSFVIGFILRLISLPSSGEKLYIIPSFLWIIKSSSFISAMLSGGYLFLFVFIFSVELE